MLADWARLQIPPAEVKHYQELIKGYVGATVDDVSLGEDGKTYYINGKSIDSIWDAFYPFKVDHYIVYSTLIFTGE